jgi:hypothetical protein
MMANPLPPVIESYQVTMDCFKIAHRTIKEQQVRLFPLAQWPTQPDAQQQIATAITISAGVQIFRFGQPRSQI